MVNRQQGGTWRYVGKGGLTEEPFFSSWAASFFPFSPFFPVLDEVIIA